MGLEAVPDISAEQLQNTTDLTVTEAADSGNDLALMIAMRSIVAARIQDESTASRDLASLTKRLTEINQEIKSLNAQEEQRAEENGRIREDEAFDASAV